jgi:GNAT superfamily N-acetyltransferase
VLLAHAISTKTTGDTVSDDDMALPPRWADASHAPAPAAAADAADDARLGHKEEGRTLCLHSLAVLPEYQGAGLGATLVKSYLQRMQAAEVADRVALLAEEKLVGFYEKLGFKNRGKSAATYGGGGWFDMVYEFKDAPPSPSMMGFG